MILHPTGRFDWEHMLRRCRLPATVKHVGLTLATFADADGSNIWPGVSRLALTSSLSERSVRGSLTQLRDVGLIERTVKGGMRGTRAITDVHRLTLPEDLMELVELLTVDEEVDPNRHEVPPGKQPQPAAGAASVLPNRQLTHPNRQLTTSQPAANDLPTGSSCTPPEQDQPTTSTRTRTAAVQTRTQPPTAHANQRCNEHGHEFGGWPCGNCAADHKAAS